MSVRQALSLSLGTGGDEGPCDRRGAMTEEVIDAARGVVRDCKLTEDESNSGDDSKDSMGQQDASGDRDNDDDEVESWNNKANKHTTGTGRASKRASHLPYAFQQATVDLPEELTTMSERRLAHNAEKV